MPKSKDPFEDLVADETLLTPDPDLEFSEDEIASLIDAPAKSSLPAHIKRSHRQEEDDWNFNILVSANDRLSLKVGSKAAAEQKRNRLYNARTYLKYTEQLRLQDPAYHSPLDDWSILLQERSSVWYVVLISVRLTEGWQAE